MTPAESIYSFKGQIVKMKRGELLLRLESQLANATAADARRMAVHAAEEKTWHESTRKEILEFAAEVKAAKTYVALKHLLTYEHGNTGNRLTRQFHWSPPQCPVSLADAVRRHIEALGFDSSKTITLSDRNSSLRWAVLADFTESAANRKDLCS